MRTAITIIHLRAPLGNITIACCRYEPCCLLRTREHIIPVLVASLALLDGGFFAGELCGTGSVAAIGDDAASEERGQEEADEGPEEYEGVKELLFEDPVKETMHGVACFGYTAADEDFDEGFGSLAAHSS